MTTQATHQVFAVHPRDKIHADLFGANCFKLTMHCAVKAILACSIGCTDLTKQVLVNSTELLLVRPKRLGVLNQRGNDQQYSA